MGSTRICYGNAPLQLCITYKKRKDALNACVGTQDGCEPFSASTYYTNCGGLNQGCYLYELISGEYKPVKNGYYSDGVNSYYVQDGLVQPNPVTCPRFFKLDWIKDCFLNNNLSGTYYVTVGDDNSWVPDINVVYRLYIPLVGDCNEQFTNDYYAIRFENTTPIYNIGNANYLEARLDEMTPTYKLPGFLQNRCTTRQIT